MAKVTRKYARPRGVTCRQAWVRDDGQPEYLDGAQMQYSVQTGDGYCTIAYCVDLECAELLADAINAKGGRDAIPQA